MFNFEVYTVEQNSEKEYGPKKGDKRVKFPELNIDYSISTDTEGHSYFSVPNYDHFQETGSRLDTLFQGRITDAVESIRKGYGDCLNVTQMFGPLGFRTIKVFRFLDRVHGEKLRKETIEGWKDAVFGWGIEVGSKSSFSGLTPLCEDGTAFTPFYSAEEQSPILFFDTHEAAEIKVKELREKSQQYANEYLKLTEDSDRKKFLNEMEGTLSFRNEIFNWMFSLVEGGDEEKSNFCVEIRQSVKNK